MVDMEHEKEDAVECHDICEKLQELIDREKTEGDATDVKLLEKAYTIVETVCGHEEAETKGSMATMPLHEARKKVMKSAFKAPKVSKNEFERTSPERPESDY